jgi:hypothetical protein
MIHKSHQDGGEDEPPAKAIQHRGERRRGDTYLCEQSRWLFQDWLMQSVKDAKKSGCERWGDKVESRVTNKHFKRELRGRAGGPEILAEVRRQPRNQI